MGVRVEGLRPGGDLALLPLVVCASELGFGGSTRRARRLPHGGYLLGPDGEGAVGPLHWLACTVFFFLALKKTYRRGCEARILLAA